MLAADYTIRISVENRSSDYVYEVVDNVLVVLEVLCNIDSIAVVFVFFDFLDSWTKFILLGTKKGFRFSGLVFGGGRWESHKSHLGGLPIRQQR